MKDHVEGCPLSRRVILSDNSTLIHPVTGGPSLFPRSHTRTSIGSSYDSLSSFEEKYGLTTFRLHVIGWVRDHLFAGEIMVCDRKGRSSYSRSRTFWFKSISIFDLSLLTTFISSSLMFPIPSDSSSRPL